MMRRTNEQWAADVVACCASTGAPAGKNGACARCIAAAYAERVKVLADALHAAANFLRSGGINRPAGAALILRTLDDARDGAL